jgi:hypothetical protein
MRRIEDPGPEDPPLIKPYRGYEDEATALFERPYLKKNSIGPCSDPIF